MFTTFTSRDRCSGLGNYYQMLMWPTSGLKLEPPYDPYDVLSLFWDIARWRMLILQRGSRILSHDQEEKLQYFRSIFPGHF
jgi:hypothetical protein